MNSSVKITNFLIKLFNVILWIVWPTFIQLTKSLPKRKSHAVLIYSKNTYYLYLQRMDCAVSCLFAAPIKTSSTK